MWPASRAPQKQLGLCCAPPCLGKPREEPLLITQECCFSASRTLDSEPLAGRGLVGRGQLIDRYTGHSCAPAPSYIPVKASWGGGVDQADNGKSWRAHKQHHSHSQEQRETRQPCLFAVYAQLAFFTLKCFRAQGNGSTHGGLHLPTSINNQDDSPQTLSQTNLMQTVPQ